MDNFVRNFERQPNGSWLCIAFAEVRTFSGRIQVAEGSVFMPGTIFMGVDIVKCLEEEAERQKRF
jgi:hypothetical protein